MKKFTLTLLTAVLIFGNTFAQNRSRFHQFIKRSDIERGYLRLVYKNKNGQKEKITLCSEVRPAIITLDGTIPVVDFWQIVDNNNRNIDTCLSQDTELGRFEIDLSRSKIGDPAKYVIIPFAARTWGIGTNPFKYRLKSDSSSSIVSSNLGINVNYGWTFGRSTISQRAITNYYVTLGVFTGVSSVDLIKSTVKSPNTWKTDRTNVAVTYGVNAIFARNNFGLVLSFGFDHNYGTDSKKWSFQNKPWIGLGINTSLGLFE